MGLGFLLHRGSQGQALELEGYRTQEGLPLPPAVASCLPQFHPSSVVFMGLLDQRFAGHARVYSVFFSLTAQLQDRHLAPCPSKKGHIPYSLPSHANAEFGTRSQHL